DDEGVKAVWPRDISADHILLSLIHAVFNPCACALSRLIQAIFALPDDAFKLLLAHSGKHVNGSDIALLRDTDAGRAQLANRLHEFSAFRQRRLRRVAPIPNEQVEDEI